MEKRVMDDVTRKKLQSLLPFGKDSAVKRTPEFFFEFPSEYQPVFILRPLIETAKKYVRDHCLSGTLDKSASAKAFWDSGIRWENLHDGGDLEKEIACNESALAEMPDKLFMWIDQQVSELTYGPSELEKEGLESLPQPTSPAESPKTVGNADVPKT